MRKLLNKAATYLFNLFANVKIENILDLVAEMAKALKDGQISEEERKNLIEKASLLFEDLKGEKKEEL